MENQTNNDMENRLSKSLVNIGLPISIIADAVSIIIAFTSEDSLI